MASDQVPGFLGRLGIVKEPQIVLPDQPMLDEPLPSDQALPKLAPDQHDQHVAAELAREYVATSGCSGPELKAVGRFTAYLDGDVERMRRAIRSTWPPIVGSRYRRSLGRAVARL